MRYWISIFKTLIDYVNKEQNEHLKKVTDNMVNNPVEFFKFYDKKFKKSWEFFYKRVVKMSTKYVKSEN